jgi:hypothetical protein
MKIASGLIGAFLLSLIMVAGNRTAQPVLPRCQIYTVTMDSLLDGDEQDRLSAHIVNALLHNTERCFLNHQFSCIKSVTQQIQPGSIQEIAFASFVPLVVINGELVLTEHGIFLSRSSYASECLAQLPGLQVLEAVQDMQAPYSLCALVAGLPSVLYERFTITWKASTHIVFCDKEHPDLVIISDKNHVLDQDRWKACDHLYEHMKKLKKTPLIADMRFENHIVCHEKGGYYGQHFC